MKRTTGWALVVFGLAFSIGLGGLNLYLNVLALGRIGAGPSAETAVLGAVFGMVAGTLVLGGAGYLAVRAGLAWARPETHSRRAAVQRVLAELYDREGLSGKPCACPEDCDRDYAACSDELLADIASAIRPEKAGPRYEGLLHAVKERIEATGPRG